MYIDQFGGIMYNNQMRLLANKYNIIRLYGMPGTRKKKREG